MDTKKRTIGMPTLAILVIVIAMLASSTMYFAYQSRPGKSTGTYTTPVTSKFYSIPFAGDVVALAAGSDTQTSVASSSSNTITVGGTGGVSYIPNEALVSVSVLTEDSTAEQATSSNAATTASVINALYGLGISNSSIDTQGYTLSTDYSNCYASTTCIPQITGYSVTNNLQVNITSSIPSQLGLQVGRVIDTAVAAGANQISLTFSETNSVLAGLTNGALRQAVASAYSQAQTIASSLGVSITGVVSASEGSAYTPQVYALSTFSTAAAATPILPGTQSMTVSVQVVYSIG